MSRKKGNKAPLSIRIVLLNVLIGIVAVLLAGSIIALISAVNDDYYHKLDSYDFVYRMEDQRYADMVRSVHEARQNGQDLSGELAEYAAVADYYEAASLYHMYQEEGRTTFAQVQKEAMEEAAEAMGALSGEKAKIDGLLKLRK